MSDNLSPEFQALLAKPADTFEAPKPVPTGDYVMTVKGFEFGKAKNEKKTPFCAFKIGFVEALPSVDAEDLTAFLNGEQLTASDHEIYLTPDSAYRMGEFLCDSCQVERGVAMAQQIQDSIGTTFVAHWDQVQGTGKNAGKVFSNITSTAAVPQD
jgi:hypothetical protein